MTQRFASATNVFLPATTGQMISYIRDPKKFKVAGYVQYVESPTMVGVYARINRDTAIQVPADEDFEWADGADRPKGDFSGLRFDWPEFTCKRRDYPFRIGNLALKQSKNTLKLYEQQAGMALSQAMTNRTKRIIVKLETVANWGTNTDTANSLNGGAGKWDTASDDPTSPKYNAIKKALLQAALNINLATNGVVEPEDLVLVISPGLAIKMSNAPELHNYLKFGPFSEGILKDSNNKNAFWGLPPSLHGFEIIVENAPIVTTRPKADASAGTRAFIKSDDSAVLLSRKGGINGNYGVPNFSTVQLYWHETELAVTSFDDVQNERVEGHVTDNFSEILAAPESGWLIQNVL